MKREHDGASPSSRGKKKRKKSKARIDMISEFSQSADGDSIQASNPESPRVKLNKKQKERERKRRKECEREREIERERENDVHGFDGFEMKMRNMAGNNTTEHQHITATSANLTINFLVNITLLHSNPSTP